MESTFEYINLPESITVVFVLLTLILALVPYFSGKDFQIIKIPHFDNKDHWGFKILAPVVLLILLLAYFPFWEKKDDDPQRPKTQSQLDSSKYELLIIPSSGDHGGTKDMVTVTIWDTIGKSDEVKTNELLPGIHIIDTTKYLYGMLKEVKIEIEEYDGNSGLDRAMIKHLKLRKLQSEEQETYEILFPGPHGVSFGESPNHLNDCIIPLIKGQSVFKTCK